ncbi:hypothetical protein Taro_042806, partial [Colocasia esculenta]|nr:hypothetical protein [Colocasia esculenta]
MLCHVLVVTEWSFPSYLFLSRVVGGLGWSPGSLGIVATQFMTGSLSPSDPGRDRQVVAFRWRQPLSWSYSSRSFGAKHLWACPLRGCYHYLDSQSPCVYCGCSPGGSCRRQVHRWHFVFRHLHLQHLLEGQSHLLAVLELPLNGLFLTRVARTTVATFATSFHCRHAKGTGAVIPFGLKEDQLCLGVRVLKGDFEEGDLLVTNEKNQWTDDDRKKVSLNCKAKSILCCALSKKEFNRVSACKSTMEMWEKLRITNEGTDKVKETRIDILVTQYERFQMQPGESITQMFSRFTNITNGLTGLGKTYEIGDIVRKILRSLPSSWTPKVTAIEEANDLKRMSLEKLIGSLMAHEINMERLGESSSRKKHTNALKAAEGSSEEQSEDEASSKDSEDEEAMLSRRLQRILAKKKKFQSSRRYYKNNKELKNPEGKDFKKAEPICYECKKPGHLKAECPKLKKSGFRKKDSSRKFRKYKKKAMAAAWDNNSESNSE